jgi:hypothetical protein
MNPFFFKREYDYDPEPGMDFTHDEHGNIFYGRGFSGAPRLPYRNLGMDAKEFVEKYEKIDKKYRLEFLNDDRSNISYEFNMIIFYLENYEKDQDKNTLIKKLSEIAKKFIPDRSYSYQLKYFLEIYKMIENLMNEKTHLPIPNLDQFLDSTISRQSILRYEDIHKKFMIEETTKEKIKYITDLILSTELNCAKSKNFSRNIKIFVKDLNLNEYIKEILNEIMLKLKEKFVDFDIYLDEEENFIYINWS